MTLLSATDLVSLSDTSKCRCRWPSQLTAKKEVFVLVMQSTSLFAGLSIPIAVIPTNLANPCTSMPQNEAAVYDSTSVRTCPVLLGPNRIDILNAARGKPSWKMGQNQLPTVVLPG